MARKKKRNNGQSNGNGLSPKATPPPPKASSPEVLPEASTVDDDTNSQPVASTSRPGSIQEEASNGQMDVRSGTENTIKSNNDEAILEDADRASSEASGSGTPAELQVEADDSEESEDEDEDEEPTLRYNRIHSQAVTDLFQKDTCSCLTVSERYLVLGSHNGLVTIFSRPGFPRSAATAAGASPSKGKGRAVEEKVSMVEAEGEYIVKRYRAHTAGIMDIVIDEESQFIGTASMDGKVIIYHIATNDAQAFDLGRPLRCLSLEPMYASRSTRQFVSGGMAGNLTLHEKGWLGPKDVVLHSGEGPIWSTQWRRNYIAWANDGGVRIYDTHTSTRIASIPRPENSPRADLYPCYLLWQHDNRLVIGWADFIRTVDIRDRKYQQDVIRKQEEEKELLKASSDSIKSGKSGKSTIPSMANPLAGMGSYMPAIPTIGSPAIKPTYAEVTNVLKLDCMISGIVPFVALDEFSVAPSSATQGSHSHVDTTAYIIFSYITEDGADEESFQSLAKPSHPPELRIIDVESGEELSSDILGVSQFERYQCRDYRIVGSYSAKSPQASYFATSPTDLIEVKKRDVGDHIAWLCERKRYEEALRVAEKEGLKGISSGKLGDRNGFSVKEIGYKYLEYLFAEGEYATAARNMSKTLGQDAKAWEDWIFRYVQQGQIETIIPNIPTSSPKLDHIVYEMVLAHFLGTNPNVNRSQIAATYGTTADTLLPQTLLQVLKTWPSDLYESQAVINAIMSALDQEDKSSETTRVLMECLVEIYSINRQPGRALPYYLRLRKPGVFDLIRQNNLFADVHDQALLLVDFQQDMKRRTGHSYTAIHDFGKGNAEADHKHGEAIELLVDHTQSIPISRVVKQLSANRYYLYMYLDALALKDPHSAFEYSDDLVDLYAEYDYARLLDCLRASTSYNLERAYEICKKRDYVPEMVFLLGRMGNNKQALMLIIERLGDVQRAIDFAKEQNDADLWEDLLKYAESKPTFIRGLLENVGPEVDPIRLIRRIKNGLEIPGLKPAIIKILQDFNIQISLIEGCKTILNADCRSLTLELYDGQTNASLGSIETTMCYKCHKPAFLPSQPTTSTPASATTAEATSIIFLCRHIFHVSCALPDVDLPSRPQHFLNPLLAGNLDTSNEKGAPRFDQERDLAAKILFASQLKSRSSLPVSCPACLAGKGSRVL